MAPSQLPSAPWWGTKSMRTEAENVRRTAGVRAVVLMLHVLVLLALVVGCRPQHAPQRAMFDEAEEAYRNGHYDEALEQYEAFLKASPDHQLAPIAQQRVLSIERELKAVMGRRKGPRPIYLRPMTELEEGDRARSPLPSE